MLLFISLSQFLYLKVAIVVPTSGTVWRKFLTHSKWINKYWISLSICVFVFSCNNHLLSIYYGIETQFSREENKQEIFLPPGAYIQMRTSVQFSCCRVWLCGRMDCSTPSLPAHHQFPEFTPHVHRVGDAIQLSHLLSSPSLPDLNLSQHQSIFQWVSSLHQVAKVLEF